MMDNQIWINNILSAIKELSDVQYQTKVWLEGKGTEVSSFDEAICRLFDDYELDSFIEKFSSMEQVSLKKIVLLKKYREQLTNYLSTLKDEVSIEQLITDPAWKKLCQLAKETYDNLNDSYK